MKDFKTRKSTQKPFYHSWFFLAFLVLVLSFFVKSTHASFSKKRNADLEKDKYELRLNNLKQKKINLETKIEHMKTNRGIEEELRKRFNVTKEGEQLIKIIENDS